MPHVPRNALHSWETIQCQMKGKRLVIFSDYDGTLTPIVNNPDLAVMSEEMRNTVSRVGAAYPTAIVTGRSREKIMNFVQLNHMHYAASHGFDIVHPEGGAAMQVGAAFCSCLAKVKQELLQNLEGIPGAALEDNVFCLSVHYRNVEEAMVPMVRAIVDEILKESDELKMDHGKCVFELKPAVEWDKGFAVKYLLQQLGFVDASQYVAVYLGDDVADEAAFRAIGNSGVSILVSESMKETSARYQLASPQEVQIFLQRLIDLDT